MTATCALILAATLSSVPADQSAGVVRPASLAPIAAAVVAAPPVETAPERWMLDRKLGRPAAVQVMYGTLGVLQALDVYSTRRALNGGGNEINPLMKKAAGNQAAMIAVKALSTAGSVYFAERAWKKNRKGAVLMMALVNGITAAVVARNLSNAR